MFPPVGSCCVPLWGISSFISLSSLSQWLRAEGKKNSPGGDFVPQPEKSIRWGVISTLFKLFHSALIECDNNRDMRMQNAEGREPEPSSIPALNSHIGSRWRKPQPKQKRNKHLFANIANKKHAGLTLFCSLSAQHRARWSFLPLSSHHVFWFLLNELRSSKMSSLLQTLLSLAAHFLLISEAQHGQ